MAINIINHETIFQIMKMNACFMALLFGLSIFSGIISPMPVSADSAAGGNDAADTEATSTVIPSENTWYHGEVNNSDDEYDFYEIDLEAADTMEIVITVPQNDVIDFEYWLDGNSPNGVSSATGNSYNFNESNDGGNTRTLVLLFANRNIPVEQEYCFKVNKDDNLTSALNANPCAPVVPAVSVSGNTEGTSIMWDISFVNLTIDTEVTLNYSITLDSEIQESNSISWTTESSEQVDGSESIETDFVTAGEWCLDATLWQHDQPQHVSDSLCIIIEEPSNSVVNIDWIDTTAFFGAGEANFSVHSEGIWTAYWGVISYSSEPPQWNTSRGWWDAGVSGGLSTTTENGDYTWNFERMEEYGALSAQACYVLIISLFDGTTGNASAQSTPAIGYPVSTDFELFQLDPMSEEDCEMGWDDTTEEPYLHVDTDQRHWSGTEDVIISFEAGGLDTSIEWVMEFDLYSIREDGSKDSIGVELVENDPRYGIEVDSSGTALFEFNFGTLSDNCYSLEFDITDQETLGTYQVGPFEFLYSVGTGDCGDETGNNTDNDWCDQLEGFAGAVWDPLLTYAIGDVVEYPANSGQFYKAKSPTSSDNPSENSDAWDGPCSCEDIWMGQVWSSSDTFGQLEIVQDNGKLWISKLNSNSGHQPSSSPNWWRACSSECSLANGSAGWWYDQTQEQYQLGDVVEFPANSGNYFVSTMNGNTAHPTNGELRGWVECSCSEIWESGHQPVWDASAHYEIFEVVEHNGEFYVRTFAYNLPFSTTPEPGVNPTWRSAWKKCDTGKCDSTGPYSQIYANMGIYDKGVAVAASFGSAKIWTSKVHNNDVPPPGTGFYAPTWLACFEDPRPPIRPELVAGEWIGTPGGVDDDIRKYARMMKGSVVSYTDDVTDKRMDDHRSGERCADIDLDRYSGIDIECENVEVLVIGDDTSKYGCWDSWPPVDDERPPWNEGCEIDGENHSVAFESSPPIVVSTCDIDALNDVGVYVESNDMTDVAGHLMVESSGMNPGDINCGAQVLLKVDYFSEYEDDGTSGRTKYICKNPSYCFIDTNGNCWVKPSGGDWTQGNPDGNGNCDTGTNQPTPFPPWMVIQNAEIDGVEYILISAPGQTCDTIELSDILVGSTCNDAVVQVGTPVQKTDPSTTLRSNGGSCTDTTHQMYEIIIASSAADTRWLGPNGIMQPSNLVTPDSSWGTFTPWGQAEWVGQPSHTSATAQPQWYFFTHEFALPYHAKELDFSWHGMASDQFGLDQSSSKSGGVSIDGYPAAGYTEIIFIDPATWNSAPHHDQEAQWASGKTWTPVNPSQKYILQTIISNDDTQSIQGLIYELKVEFCMDPQYESHLPDTGGIANPDDIDPNLDNSPVVDKAEDESIPGFLGVFAMIAIVAAAIKTRKD